MSEFSKEVEAVTPYPRCTVGWFNLFTATSGIILAALTLYHFNHADALTLTAVLPWLYLGYICVLGILLALGFTEVCYYFRNPGRRRGYEWV